MRRAASGPATRRWVALAAALLPILLVLGSSPSADPVVLTLVLLAFAACTVARGTALLPRPGVVTPLREEGAAPMRRGRPTDPAHHPLAPRAPGLA